MLNLKPHHYTMLAVLIALFVNAFTTAGFMAVKDSRGFLKIEICTGQGIIEIATPDSSKKDNNHADIKCDFAPHLTTASWAPQHDAGILHVNASEIITLNNQTFTTHIVEKYWHALAPPLFV